MALAVLDQGVFAISNLVISILLARWMRAEDYGAYAIVLSVFLLFASIHSVLILEPMTIFGSRMGRVELSAYSYSLLRIHTLMSLVGFSLSLLAAQVLMAIGGPSALTQAFIGAGLAQAMILLFWFARRACYVRLRPLRAASGSIAYGVLAVAGLATLNRFLWVMPLQAYVVIGLAALGASILILPSLISPTEIILRLTKVLRRSWKYAKWLMLPAFLYWMTTSAYYPIAGVILDLGEIAALRALSNFVIPPIQFVIAISLLFMPWASARYAAQGKDRLRKDTWAFTGAATTVSLIYWVFLIVAQDSLLELFYADRYRTYAWLLPLLGAIPVLISLTSGWLTAIRIMEKTSLIFTADLIGAVSTITLGIFLTMRLGIAGTAIGLIASAGGRLFVLPWLWSRATMEAPRADLA